LRYYRTVIRREGGPEPHRKRETGALAHEQGQGKKVGKSGGRGVREQGNQGIGPNLAQTQDKYVIGRAARHEGALVSRTPRLHRVKLKMHRHDDLFALQKTRTSHCEKSGDFI